LSTLTSQNEITTTNTAISTNDDIEISQGTEDDIEIYHETDDEYNLDDDDDLFFQVSTMKH